MPNRAPRRMPPQSTRNLIVEEADALFYESGFEATSFAEIAKAVGISRGNFYHHFKTKDDILDAVIARRMGLTRSMLDGWQTEGEDPRGRILLFVHMLIVNRAQIMDFGCPVGTLCSELANSTTPHRAARPKFSAFTATGSPNRSVSLVPLIGQKRWRYIF